MQDVITLQPRAKTGTSETRILRGKKQVPGVLYGDKIENNLFSVPIAEIARIKELSKGSGLVDVLIEGSSEPVKAILQDVQLDPVTDVYKHLDLFQVRMDKKLSADIHLEFTGEAPAVKDLGGILVKQYDEISVECLPNDLISSLEVPIGVLKTFSDVIRVKDLQLPKTITTNMEPNAIIVSVTEPRSDEEIEELSSEVSDSDGPEVLTEKKDEDAESASEGDSASSGDETSGNDKASDKEQKDKKE